MSKLLLDKERPLRQSQENPKVQEDTKVPTVARARTLTVLSRLYSDRKARMVRFLNEARLIDPDDVVLALHKADLKGINLSQTELFGAAMIGADLREAVFYSCDFSKADLSGADLSGASLSSVNLTHANVTEKQLNQTESLYDTTMPDGQRLRGYENSNGPTFEEWLKSREGDGR